MRTCASCRFDNVAEAQFCASCGTALAVPSAAVVPGAVAGAAPGQRPVEASPPCAVCGARPTVSTPIAWSLGLVIFLHHQRIGEDLCRDCGTHYARRYLDRTLMLGWWWVLGFITNLIFIGFDVVALVRYRMLAEPKHPGGVRQYLDPGRPLWQRPGIYVVIVAVVVLRIIS